jgi:RNA polymerase sigma-70 factor (ECF subfamily)
VHFDDELIENAVSAENHEKLFFAKTLLAELFGGHYDPSKVTTQTIAVLHYSDGLTLEETAEVTGLSVSGVRKRLDKLKEKALKAGRV